MHTNRPQNPTAAVVVTHNRIDLLRQCVAQLENQTCACDILIVDNASTDGTGRETGKDRSRVGCCGMRRVPKGQVHEKDPSNRDNKTLQRWPDRNLSADREDAPGV